MMTDITIANTGLFILIEDKLILFFLSNYLYFKFLLNYLLIIFFNLTSASGFNWRIPVVITVSPG